MRALRSRVLRDAAFVAARSETAAELARSWGARGEVRFAPHAVPDGRASRRGPSIPSRSATRADSSQSKGLNDLLEAVGVWTRPSSCC